MVHIRDFRPADAGALTQLYQTVFSEENRINGITPDDLAQRIRLAATWHMIPFRLLTAIAGYKWAILMAEVDGQIAGSGMFVGRRQRADFSSLAVLPEHRRRGIGAALVRERLKRATACGFAHATAAILSSNVPSLRNLQKQGFEIYDRTTEYDVHFPLDDSLSSRAVGIIGRPIRSSDRPLFETLERQVVGQDLLEVEGTSVNRFFPSLRQRLLLHWGRSHFWARAYEYNGRPIGFAFAEAAAEGTKGFLSRPIMPPGEGELWQMAQRDAATWLMGLGKSGMRVLAPGELADLSAYANAVVWLSLRKRLEAEHNAAGD